LAGRKFVEFGKLQAIRQTKTIQISTYNYTLLAEFIHSPNFFLPNLLRTKFAKHYAQQTSLLYSIGGNNNLSTLMDKIWRVNFNIHTQITNIHKIDT